MGSVAPHPGASSITVAVRVRPFTIREAAQLSKSDEGTRFLGDGSLAAAPTPKLHQKGLRSVIKVVDDRCLVFDPPEDNPVQKFSRSVVPTGKKVKDQVFAFDRVYDDNANQTDVYEGTTKQLLDSVLDGYNATVFAYGATGCGKTHTITGTAQMPGIIFLTMQELFEKIHERSDEKVTEISLSYLEIYNETIRDLLVPGGSKQGLVLREDSQQTVSVSGLSSHHPKDVQEVMDIIVQGNEYRTVSPTAANATSSRSHAVLQINVAQRDRNSAVSEPHTMATLSIIDLAGSERATATLNRGVRLKEGANINKSLLALGSCINALCDPKKFRHVPYRDSKLTRLLKFSLGGNCKTVMIVCVSPSSAHFDETQNTLRYANRAKNIQTKVTRNVFNVNRHVKDFLVKIDEQLAVINQMKAQQKDAEKIFFAKFQKQLEKQNSAVKEGVARIRTAYEHTLGERQEKVNAMKQLKTFERRVRLLSAWMGAFDTVCDARDDGNQGSMPPPLLAMRKTALGLLSEFENSRQYLHRKNENSKWDRALATALTNSIQQLPEAERRGDSTEAATLYREVDHLREQFENAALRELAEHDKSSDAATMQALLTAHFEILTSLDETREMSEDDAVRRAKGIINKLLDTGLKAASNVVKPDGSVMPVEMYPPTKRGTPKRKRASLMYKENAKPLPPPTFAAAANPVLASLQEEELGGSPMLKGSPRRRKVNSPRKGVSFTPVKKKKSLRWRDDDGEEGTLAEYSKTPTKIDFTPEQPSPKTVDPDTSSMSAPPPIPAYLEDQNEDSVGDLSSPSLEISEGNSLVMSKPNRFKAGFLNKKTRPSQGGSPSLPAPPQMSLNLSDADNSSILSMNGNSPLRTMDPATADNTQSGRLSSPQVRGTRIPSPKPLLQSSAVITSMDENHPPSATNSASGSDSESPAPGGFNPHKLRNALAAKRHSRVSSIGLPSSSSSRTSNGMTSSSHHMSGSGGGSNSSSSALGSSGRRSSLTNGVSRNRRGSAERRRSPPMTCSPPDLLTSRSVGPGFTPGQARRMNLGGSVRGSPGERAIVGAGTANGGTRRVTIGAGGQQLAGGQKRGGVAWR